MAPVPLAGGLGLRYGRIPCGPPCETARKLPRVTEDTNADSGRALDGSPDEERPPRFRHRKVLAAALILLLIPLVAVAGFAAYLNHVVTANVQHGDLLPRAAPEVTTGADGTPTTKAPPAAPVGKGQNYLLLGSDAGPGRVGGRSDVIILVHVPEDHAKVQLIHFPRDLYVAIPGYGKDKINAAFAYGGVPLIVQTMQNLLSVPIDHVALIGFEGFKAMTDAVGGVDVNVEESSNEGGFVFTKGMMHLNGDQALAFVRERHQLSEGDISRGRRQQAFLKALMLKGLSRDTLTNPAQLTRFIEAAAANLTVDQSLDVGQMRGEAYNFNDLRGDNIRFITAPLTGFGTSPVGGSIDLVDVAKMTVLGAAIAGDHLDAYAG